MPARTTRRFPWVALRFAAFTVPLYLHVWLLVRPEALFGARPRLPVFYADTHFLSSFLRYPGGLLEYVAGLLSLSYMHSWSGALVISAVVALTCWGADVLIQSMGGGHARVLAFAPGLLVLVALNMECYQITVLLSLLAAALALVFYLGLAGGGEGRRIVTFMVVSLVLYCVAGGAFLIFAVTVAVYELLGRGARVPGLVSLLAIEAVPYVLGLHLYQVSLWDAFGRTLVFHPTCDWAGKEAVTLAYLTFPILALTFGMASAFRRRRARRATGKTLGTKSAPLNARRSFARELSLTAGTLVVTVGLGVATLGQLRAGIMRIDHLARTRQWDAVLQEASALPRDDYIDRVMEHVNRALYETGRLPNDMFRYPQTPGGVMVDTSVDDLSTQQARLHHRIRLWFSLGDTELQLGLVSEAEWEAHEALATSGPHPEILQRLVMCNLVRRRPEVARVILNRLALHPTHGQWARATLSRMATEPTLDTDPEVQRIRANMPVNDLPSMPGELSAKCLALLDENPRNRMAFEYLMGHYLTSMRLEEFAREFPRIANLDYEGIPRLYEEAIFATEVALDVHIDRCGRQISDETLRDLAAFQQVYDAWEASGKSPAAEAELARQFGNSYLYYTIFQESGVGED